jgi:hypothetical protein
MKSILAFGLLTLLLIPRVASAEFAGNFEAAYDESLFSEMLEISSLESQDTEKQFSSSPDDIHRAKMVIVINKSTIGSTAQKMKIYIDGTLAYEWKVSTGREKLEKAKSGRVYVTTTPVGYFRPTKLVANYHSNTWKADMPNAVFFIGGIAIHASNHIEQLGQRASGGCIRLAPSNAKALFQLIKKMEIQSVDAINRSGKTALNRAGNPLKVTNRDVLIIVENRI